MPSIKSVLKGLDSVIPGGPLRKAAHLFHVVRIRFAYFLTSSAFRVQGDRFGIPGNHRQRISLVQSRDEIGELCDEMGSDKGSAGSPSVSFPWETHRYSTAYSFLFAPLRSSTHLVFECGIGTNHPDIPSNMTEVGRPGASLRVWERYFTEAEIIGADIDERVLFNQGRISTFQVDQTNSESIEEMWRRVGKTGFDIMIDDGLHTINAAMSLIEGSWIHLRPGGIYVIEDVARGAASHYLRELQKRNIEASIISFDSTPGGVLDTCLCVIVKPES